MHQALHVLDAPDGDRAVDMYIHVIFWLLLRNLEPNLRS